MVGNKQFQVPSSDRWRGRSRRPRRSARRIPQSAGPSGPPRGSFAVPVPVRQCPCRPASPSAAVAVPPEPSMNTPPPERWAGRGTRSGRWPRWACSLAARMQSRRSASVPCCALAWRGCSRPRREVGEPATAGARARPCRSCGRQLPLPRELALGHVLQRRCARGALLVDGDLGPVLARGARYPGRKVSSIFLFH